MENAPFLQDEVAEGEIVRFVTDADGLHWAKEEFPLVAFTVPADAGLGGIKASLVRGQENGWWHYEVACATGAWRDA